MAVDLKVKAAGLYRSDLIGARFEGLSFWTFCVKSRLPRSEGLANPADVGCVDPTSVCFSLTSSDYLPILLAEVTVKRVFCL